MISLLHMLIDKYTIGWEDPIRIAIIKINYASSKIIQLGFVFFVFICINGKIIKQRFVALNKSMVKANKNNNIHIADVIYKMPNWKKVT